MRAAGVRLDLRRLEEDALRLLVRRWCDRPLAWLWCVLRRRPLLSPELREAGTLFRRQKHGQVAPRVLAFGQRRPRPWRTESFLLTESEAPHE